MYCPKCGTRLITDANYCHQCGFCVASDEADIASADDEPVGVADEPAEVELPRASQTGVRASGAEKAPESEVWEGRFSPKALVASFAMLIAATAAGVIGILVAAVSDTRWLLVSLLLSLPALWVLQLARLAKRFLSAHYRLTDRRLFIERGLLHRHKDQLDLARVEDVRIQQHVLHRFLDVGAIEILSSDRRLRRVVMQGVSDADDLAETIRSLARRRRSETAPALAAAKP